MFDAGGFIFGWHVRQWVHKIVTDSIIHSGSFSADLTVIHLTKEQFNNIKIHEREFRLHGEMFDVVWKVENRNELTLYCYRDNAEENLIAEFIGFLANKTNEHNSSKNGLLQSICIGFMFFTPETYNNIQFPQEGERFSLRDSQSTIFQYKRVDIPPPRTVSA